MSMKCTRLVALAAVAMIGLAACETKEHADAEMHAVSKAKDVARQTSAQSDISAADEEFGIPECDDYVRKMNACINDKVPADEQSALRFQLGSTKRTWQKESLDPSQRDSLASECRDAASLAARSTEQYGCQW